MPKALKNERYVMKKRIICFLSVLLTLSLLLAACTESKPENTSGGASDAVSQQSTESADVNEPADEVETDLSGYSIAVQPMDHEREDEPTFDGFGVDEEFPYATDEVRLNVAVRDDTAGSDVFDIFVRCCFPSYFLQEGNPVTGTLHARLGDKWLFSVRGSIGEDEDYYIYDAVEKSLKPLDSAATVLYFGDRILTHAAVYSEEAQGAANLYDWSGDLVTAYDGVSDLTVSDGRLYMLRYADPMRLCYVPAEALSGETNDLTAVNVCDLGPCCGMFYEENSIVLQPYSGGYSVTCPIAEAADTVTQFRETEPPADDDLVESCAAFSFTLPAWCEGKYFSESDENGVSLFFKTSEDDDEGMFLYRIGLSDGPDSLEEPGFGGDGVDYEICEIVKNGDVKYVMVSQPADEILDLPDGQYQDYLNMVWLFDDIENRLQGENGYEIRLFEYESLIGMYIGESEYGGEYELGVNEVQRNLFNCTLYYRDEYTSELLTDVTVRMFGNGGALMWGEWDDDFENYTFVTGVFLQEEEGFSLMLNAPGDSWTNTQGEYIPLEYIVSPNRR